MIVVVGPKDGNVSLQVCPAQHLYLSSWQTGLCDVSSKSRGWDALMFSFYTIQPLYCVCYLVNIMVAICSLLTTNKKVKRLAFSVNGYVCKCMYILSSKGT